MCILCIFEYGYNSNHTQEEKVRLHIGKAKKTYIHILYYLSMKNYKLHKICISFMHILIYFKSRFFPPENAVQNKCIGLLHPDKYEVWLESQVY